MRIIEVLYGFRAGGKAYYVCELPRPEPSKLWFRKSVDSETLCRVLRLYPEKFTASICTNTGVLVDKDGDVIHFLMHYDRFCPLCGARITQRVKDSLFLLMKNNGQYSVNKYECPGRYKPNGDSPCFGYCISVSPGLYDTVRRLNSLGLSITHAIFGRNDVNTEDFNFVISFSSPYSEQMFSILPDMFSVSGGEGKVWALHYTHTDFYLESAAVQDSICNDVIGSLNAWMQEIEDNKIDSLWRFGELV